MARLPVEESVHASNTGSGDSRPLVPLREGQTGGGFEGRPRPRDAGDRTSRPVVLGGEVDGPREIAGARASGDLVAWARRQRPHFPFGESVGCEERLIGVIGPRGWRAEPTTFLHIYARQVAVGWRAGRIQFGFRGT